jgi:dihydrodipicolinate synthase/N-acetylneuraminate lyase
MKTTPVTTADISRSVIAVPPLARDREFRIDRKANLAIIKYIEAGGVRSLMYGGNATFFNVSIGEYVEILDFLSESVGADTWFLPSAGPDFGKLRDQAPILKSRAFPAVMVLPGTGPSVPTGVATAVRRFAEAVNKQIVLYVKDEKMLTPELIIKLVADKVVTSVKYAVVRDDPSKDDFLPRILEGVDRSVVASGIGERPAIDHLRSFGIASFTSGCVCIAPRASMKILELIKAKDYAAAQKIRENFMPLEDLRDGIGPIRVLHDAVTGAGVADMGPMLPSMDNLEAADRAKVDKAAQALFAYDQTFARAAA